MYKTHPAHNTKHTYTPPTHTHHCLLFLGERNWVPERLGTRLDQHFFFFCQCDTEIRAFTSVLGTAQEIVTSKTPLNSEASVDGH